MIKTFNLKFDKTYPEVIYGENEGLSNLIVSTILFSSRGRLMASRKTPNIYSYLFNSIPPKELDNIMASELTELIESRYRVQITSIELERDDSQRVLSIEIYYLYDNTQFEIIIQKKIKSKIVNQKNIDII